MVYSREFEKYINWIELHIDAEAGKNIMPRSAIYKKARQVKIEEMTEAEKEEFLLGKWWEKMPNERKIYIKYLDVKLENIPEEYQELVSRLRKLGVNDKIKIRFKQYIDWVKNHKDNETGKYIYPRDSIYKNDKEVALEDMTDEERQEVRLGMWWSSYPKQRKIIEAYGNLPQDEFKKIPQYMKNIINLYKQITNEEDIMKKIRKNVKEYIDENTKIRQELMNIIKEIEDDREER